MCAVCLYRSPTCPHRWLTIQNPCAPSRNFSNCPSLKDGALHILDFNGKGARYVLAVPKSCPSCDKGNYDSDTTRMVVRIRHGVRVGVGELRRGGKGGVDVPCCVVM